MKIGVSCTFNSQQMHEAVKKWLIYDKSLFYYYWHCPHTHTHTHRDGRCSLSKIQTILISKNKMYGKNTVWIVKITPVMAKYILNGAASIQNLNEISNFVSSDILSRLVREAETEVWWVHDPLKHNSEKEKIQILLSLCMLATLKEWRERPELLPLKDLMPWLGPLICKV